MPHSAFTKRHGSKSELRVKTAPTRAILSQRPFGAISSVRPRGPDEKIGPHFAKWARLPSYLASRATREVGAVSSDR